MQRGFVKRMSGPVCLAQRVLAGLFDRPQNVMDRDRDALLAFAKDDAERSLPLRMIAVLVLDRARQATSESGCKTATANRK